MGVVDALANPGEGEQAVYAYIKKQNQMYGGYQAVRRIRQRYQPIDYQELLDITAQWVDTAMQLPEKDLRTMDRLAHSQMRLVPSSVPERRAPDSPKGPPSHADPTADRTTALHSPADTG